MRRARFVITLLIFILAACAPQAQATQEQSLIVKRPTPIPTRLELPTATPTSAQANLTPAQRAAISALSGKLGLPPEKIKLVSTEAVTWPDGCLGVQRMGVMCTQAEVEGFKIILEADGKQYEFHTNQDGSSIIRAAGDLSGRPGTARTR